GDAGTDHGTAAPLFVIGDRVRGGLHGTQPSLVDLDADGDLVPTVDFRRVYAPILDVWLGANDSLILGKTYSQLPLFASSPAAPVTAPPPPPPSGYWEAGPTGHVHALGTATKFGPLGSVTNFIIGGAVTPTHKGVWLCSIDGNVYTMGDAKQYGNAHTL